MSTLASLVARHLRILQAGGWTQLSPGVLGILLGATGLGNLAFYALARRQA